MCLKLQRGTYIKGHLAKLDETRSPHPFELQRSVPEPYVRLLTAYGSPVNHQSKSNFFLI